MKFSAYEDKQVNYLLMKVKSKFSAYEGKQANISLWGAAKYWNTPAHKGVGGGTQKEPTTVIGCTLGKVPWEKEGGRVALDEIVNKVVAKLKTSILMSHFYTFGYGRQMKTQHK